MSDNPRSGSSYAGGCIISGCAIVFSIIPLLLILFSWKYDWKLGIIIGIIFFALLLIFSLYLLIPKGYNSPRLEEAKKAKEFIGYDFGKEFILKYTDHKDFEEILIEFPQKDFTQLEKFCRAHPTKYIETVKENKIVTTEIVHYLDNDKEFQKNETKVPGFTKTKSYYACGNNREKLWKLSQIKCEIDYKTRTLKMSRTIW